MKHYNDAPTDNMSTGQRRNLKPSTIAAFVLLGATGSLAYALSLFFVTILYTPTAIHREDTPLHDTLFVPSPGLYYAIIAPSLLLVNGLPTILGLRMDERIVSGLRVGKIAVPMLLAFAPQVRCSHDIQQPLTGTDRASQPWAPAHLKDSCAPLVRQSLPLPISLRILAVLASLRFHLVSEHTRRAPLHIRSHHQRNWHH
jgi:hypothetical protein